MNPMWVAAGVIAVLGFMMVSDRASTKHRGYDIELDRSKLGWNWTVFNPQTIPPSVQWSGGPLPSKADAAAAAQAYIDTQLLLIGEP